MNKKCSKCKKIKPLSLFFKGRGKKGLQAHCKDCHRQYGVDWKHENLELSRKIGREYAKEWRKKNPERLKIYRKKLYSIHRSNWLEAKRKMYITRRTLVLKYYGNKCKCCGESNYYFLTLDHINNDGFIHRKSYKGNMFNWAIKNNYPKSLRILCFNCNAGRQWYGGKDKICPHKFQD